MTRAQKSILVYSPRMGSIGGIETHLVLVCSHLSRQGWRVRLMTTTNSLNPDLRATCLDAGVSMLEMPVPIQYSRPALRALWLMGMTARHRFSRWDVIYTNALGSLAKMVWRAAGGQTRIVHHHHTAGDAEEQATWTPGFKSVLKFAPELLVCSLKSKSNIERALGRSDVRAMRYLATPLQTDGTKMRAEATGGLLHFGYVGRLVSTKGIDLICRLSEDPRMSDIRWHIHGEGKDYPPSFFAPYLNVAYHGRFSGAEDYARILDNLNAAVLFSTHSEGMPLSLIEAMSAGLPWIASDRGGTAELMLAPGNCRLLSSEPGYEETAAAVLNLAEFIRSHRVSRIDQRQAYEDYFSFPVVAKQWEDFFGASR